MKRRSRRILLRVVFYGSAVFIGLPLAFSHVMTRTYPGAFSETPAMGYEAVALYAGELKLRAWVSRGRPDKAAAVIVHGLGDNLESYLVHAHPLIERGHTVLLLDLRGHGASEGKYTSLGGFESKDVRAAMDHLRDAGLADEGIILMGHSMGAVAVILAAADQTDVAAVIAEAPFDSYRNTIADHAWSIYYLPSWVPLIPMAILAAEWRAGFDADDVDAVAAAARIDAPLLAIVDGFDERMPERVVRRIVDAHPGPNELWIAPGVHHVGAILHPDWHGVVLGFLTASGL